MTLSIDRTNRKTCDHAEVACATMKKDGTWAMWCGTCGARL